MYFGQMGRSSFVSSLTTSSRQPDRASDRRRTIRPAATSSLNRSTTFVWALSRAAVSSRVLRSCLPAKSTSVRAFCQSAEMVKSSRLLNCQRSSAGSPPVQRRATTTPVTVNTGAEVQVCLSLHRPCLGTVALVTVKERHAHINPHTPGIHVRKADCLLLELSGVADCLGDFRVCFPLLDAEIGFRFGEPQAQGEHVRWPFFGFAQPLVRAVVQEAQQPCLRVEGKVGHFVEKQSAALCRLDFADRVGHRPRERSFPMTKKGTAHQIAHEHGTVDGNKGTIGTFAVEPHPAGKHRFACTALATQEHDRIRGGDPTGSLEKNVVTGTVALEEALPLCGVEALLQLGDAPLEQLRCEDTARGATNLLGGKGFGQ